MTSPDRRRGRPRLGAFKGIADIAGLHQCPFCQRYLYQCHWCDGLHSFTVTTMTVLRSLAQGKTNDEIADDLIMTTRAVENYVGYIFREIHCLDGQKRVLACKWYLEHVDEGDKDVEEETFDGIAEPYCNGGNGLRRGDTPYVYPYPYTH